MFLSEKDHSTKTQLLKATKDEETKCRCWHYQPISHLNACMTPFCRESWRVMLHHHLLQHGGNPSFSVRMSPVWVDWREDFQIPIFVAINVFCWGTNVPHSQRELRIWTYWKQWWRWMELSTVSLNSLPLLSRGRMAPTQTRQHTPQSCCLATKVMQCMGCSPVPRNWHFNEGPQKGAQPPLQWLVRKQMSFVPSATLINKQRLQRTKSVNCKGTPMVHRHRESKIRWLKGSPRRFVSTANYSG